jgi:hypothetical protein
MIARKGTFLVVFSAFLGLLCLWTSNAGAVLVTLSGDNVIFAYDDSKLGLFGTPTVIGDTLNFNPTSFEAKSVNGSGFYLTSSTINIEIQTKSSDLFFGNITLVERGDYLMLGSGGIVGVAGALIATNNLDPLGPNVYAPISSSSNLDIIGSPINPWEAIINADLAQNGWNSITATLENILVVNTTLNPSSSFIEKKFEGLNVSVVPIPEPSTLLLTCAGLAGLSLFRRKKRALES